MSNSKISSPSLKPKVSMHVKKRDGEEEEVSFDKIVRRLKNLSIGLNVDHIKVSQRVIESIFDGVTTAQLDELSAETSMSLSTENPDYGMLAGRISISNHQKNTPKSFYRAMKILHDFMDVNGLNSPLVSKDFFETVRKHKKELEEAIDYERDFLYDYFGFKTLQRSYLMTANKEPVERIQHMWMRVAIGIHGDNIKSAIETYNLMSQKYFTHATPTLYNAGTSRPQLSSCFLIPMAGGKDTCGDSIEGIFSTLKQCSLISKWAGGIGLHIHNVRAKGSHIRGTNGTSNGIVPMLRVFNNSAVYCDQGGGKRKGSWAIYLEPWHADIEDFLEMRKNHGDESKIARDLFYALWIPDLFMKRVDEDGMWSLMCPDVCKGLSDVHGDEFEELYTKYESEGKFMKQIEARKLWDRILISQIETGTPYMLYKDSANRKSNQKNLGTIKSSNLCVSGDTKILTSKGNIPIKDLHLNDVDVWNSQEFSTVTINKTGENQNLMKISFSDGSSLKCTEYHKFFIKNKYKDDINVIEAKDLIENMYIPKYEIPEIRYNKSMNKVDSYTHGFFCGDGTYTVNNNEKHNCYYKKYKDTPFCKRHQNYSKKINNDENNICQAISNENTPLIYLYDTKKDLYKNMNYQYKYENNNHTVLVLDKKNNDKFFVPLGYDADTKISWLSGYFDADGCYIDNKGNNIQFSSINKEFLYNIKDMLIEMGVMSSINKMSDSCKRPMPDGNGGMKEYNIKNIYRMCINTKNLNKLIDRGFYSNRKNIHKKNFNINKDKYIKVTNIQKNYSIEDTYCFNEPKLHKGIFNGIMTGNCTEILEYTASDEIAVCNLASVNLTSFVDRENSKYDFEKLHEITKVITKNLNKVIDINYYPVEEARNSNMRHRPIGIGVQGLADVFCLMRYPFESDEAVKLNKDIFETIYHASLEASCECSEYRETEILEYKQLSEMNSENKDIKKKMNRLLKKNKFSEEELTRKNSCGAYDSYLWNGGSPVSKGILQYDMWDVVPSNKWNWKILKENISKYGVRNSLLVAPMPTAGTSQILGNFECFEPLHSNMYTRRTLAGEFLIINKYLMNDLIERDLWNGDMKYKIMANEGSIQNIEEIPDEIKALYKTVWEIKMKKVIDMAADRGSFIDQSQSMNLFLGNPTKNVLTSMHMYAWKKGLKTGQYYLRTKPAAKAQQFTVDPSYKSSKTTNQLNSNDNQNNEQTQQPKKVIKACLRENPDCESCGS